MLAANLYAFTIFTATYNRAHTLHRVFDSLQAQTVRDFEWLLVDDGSTDNTEELVAGWMKSADFPVRYFRQPHSGKHVAHNLAAREARGTFFLPLDSDDACPPTALERMLYYWQAIPAADRAAFSGISGLCSDQHGAVVGDHYPASPFDSTLRERKYVYRLHGEKWGSTLTDIVRQHPFPEVAGVQFVPEGMVWLEISKSYKDRCVNEIFRIYYIDDLVTGATLTRRRALHDDAAGRFAYYVWLLNSDLEFFFSAPLPFLKAAVMLPITSWLSGAGLGAALIPLRAAARALVLAALPAASFLYVVDAARGRHRR